MKKALSVFFVVALVLTSSAFGEDTQGDVHVLTTKNFDQFIKDHPATLVEFYAPWCGHCKSLEPHYEEAATKLKAAGGIFLAKVDATAETELATRFEIRGYPSLKLFKSLENPPVDYEGARTADGIAEWMLEAVGPAVQEIEEDEVAVPEKGVLIVARISSDEARAIFEDVADQLRSVAQFRLVKTDGSVDEVSVYHAGEEAADAHKFTIESDAKKLKAFITEHQLGLFSEWTQKNQKAFETRAQTLVLFVGKPGHYKKWAKEIRTAAKDFTKSHILGWMNSVDNQAAADKLISTQPSLVVQPKSGPGKFIFSEPKFHANKVSDFLHDVEAGKISLTYKSQPIPKTQPDAVKTVVADNFEAMVFQKDKDVLLEFYAPWCGHCTKLKPIYDDLAEELVDNKHIIVAKMDGDANESPAADFVVSGFPSIFWVKAGERTPVSYTGKRDIEGFLSFIKKNSSKPVKFEYELDDEL